MMTIFFQLKNACKLTLYFQIKHFFLFFSFQMKSPNKNNGENLPFIIFINKSNIYCVYHTISFYLCHSAKSLAPKAVNIPLQYTLQYLCQLRGILGFITEAIHETFL